jgi:flagellar biosynthetic protein FliP
MRIAAHIDRIPARSSAIVLASVALLLAAGAGLPGEPPAAARSDPSAVRTDLRVSAPHPGLVAEKTAASKRGQAPPNRSTAPAVVPNAPATAIPMPIPKPPQAGTGTATTANPLSLNGPDVMRSVQTVGLFALVSLAPAAVLMVTAFVRINIVLVLLRQALGSPQVPGNQVLTALALLLTALVMRPVGETVYARAIAPYAAGTMSWSEAYRAGSGPVKEFMVGQIEQTRHEKYMWVLYDLSEPESAGRAEPVYGDEFPMRVVAPAFLLSELTTALVIGFYLYLPFLVIDLVVSAVLTAMGLFMLPPSLVALPLKLILFVLADGWLLVASMLLQSFGLGAVGR